MPTAKNEKSAFDYKCGKCGKKIRNWITKPSSGLCTKCAKKKKVELRFVY